MKKNFHALFRVLKPVPAVSDYREHLFSPPFPIANTSDLTAASEVALEFDVPIPGDFPEQGFLCARIAWGNPRLELKKRNNFSCSRLQVGDDPTPVIRHHPLDPCR